MAEANQTVDVEAIVKQAVTSAVAEALKGVPAIVADQLKPLADNQKVLADTLAKLPPAGAAAAPADEKKGPKAGDAGGTLTAADVTKLLDDRDNARRVTAAKSEARRAYLDKNAAKLPDAYRRMVPETDDALELKRATDAAAAQFEADFKVGGGKPQTTVNGGGGGGAAPGAGAVDLTKLPEGQLRELAIKALPAVTLPSQQLGQPQPQAAQA